MKHTDDNEVAIKVKRYVQLLHCPYTFMSEVEQASTTGVTYKQAFEHVEEELERATGLRHYPGGYESWKVVKSKIQAKKK